jgi:hypothetical protein
MRVTHVGGELTSAARRRGTDIWHLGGVLVGAALILAASINQPFNQNELLQMAPYGSNDVSTITGATRQPPLDPLLGALVQHLLGEGQLRQRLVPALSGIGTLIVVSFILRQLKTGPAGAFGVWLLATAPLMVRFSAYTRPYALPLFLMVLFLYSTMLSLDGRRPWLVVVAATAALMPLARVVEPVVLMAATVAVLGWALFRRRLPLRLGMPPIILTVAAMAFVGYPMYRSLATKSASLFDPSALVRPHRLVHGLHELVTAFLPLMAQWFPWWPLTLLVVIAAFVAPESRRRVLSWWLFWPSLAAPVAFAALYHLATSINFDVLPYRARAAYFFVVPYTLVVVAAVGMVADRGRNQRGPRLTAALLMGALLVGQLPATVRAAFQNDVPDFQRAGKVLADRVPADAIVLYERPGPAMDWRMGFLAPDRYLRHAPLTLNVSTVNKRPGTVPPRGPVYMLINGQCARAEVRCGTAAASWHEAVPGWRVDYQFDRFTLYAPQASQSGRTGVAEALQRFARKLGPNVGYAETFAAASLLRATGNPDVAHALIRELYSSAPPEVAARIHRAAVSERLDPFARARQHRAGLG